MFNFFGIVIVLNSAIAEVDFHYNYEEYTDDGYALNEEDYVYNDTQKPKPKRIEFNIMDNVIDDTVKTSPTKSLSRTARESKFTNNLDAPAAPEASDSILTYPFAASVQRTGSHYASGALVGKRWVLTAAEGFYNVRESIKLFRVRLGSVNCKRDGKLLALQQITIHPGFSLGSPEYDLAMIRLAKPVKYTPSIRPVSLTEMKGSIEQPKFLTLYWPRIIVKGKPLPGSAKERKYHSNLRVSSQRVLSTDKCSRGLTSRRAAITKHNFCLLPLKRHHSMCMPDAGAPVVDHDGLWGIISGWVAQPCTYSDPSPAVVTRVSPAAVREWLDMQMEHDQ